VTKRGGSVLALLFRVCGPAVGVHDDALKSAGARGASVWRRRASNGNAARGFTFHGLANDCTGDTS
jgi:hypothetical protein